MAYQADGFKKYQNRWHVSALRSFHAMHVLRQDACWTVGKVRSTDGNTNQKPKRTPHVILSSYRTCDFHSANYEQ